MYINVYFIIYLPIVLLNYYWVSLADPENSVGRGGGGGLTTVFGGVLVINLYMYFTGGCSNLPRKTIGPNGSNCFSNGV